MDKKTKLRKIFSDALDIPEEQVVEDLAYESIRNWDSIAHMAMVAAIDDGFDIMLEIDDIIDMSTFGKAITILEKYGVTFQ